MYISVFNEKHYLLVSAFSLRSYIPARHKQSRLKSWSCGGFKNLVCHWIWWECSKDHPLGLFEALADRDCSGQNHYSTYSTCSNVMNFSLALSLSLSLSLSLCLSLSCDSSVQNRVLLQACQQHYYWSECELTELGNIQLRLIKWPCTF